MDANVGVIFCDWCRGFSRSDARNQFITGSSSMKLESIKKLEQSKSHITMISSGQITPLWSTHSMDREELYRANEEALYYCILFSSRARKTALTDYSTYYYHTFCNVFCKRVFIISMNINRFYLIKRRSHLLITPINRGWKIRGYGSLIMIFF